jgi:hypothetical protein
LGIGCLVYGFTIVVIWSLGRAGLLLPVPDAAVLLTIVVDVV